MKLNISKAFSAVPSLFSKANKLNIPDIFKAAWAHILIPLAVLTLYFVSFSYFLSRFIPEYSVNVNAVFANRAWKYSLLLTAGLYIVYFILFKIGKRDKLSFDNKVRKFYRGDLILVLLPLTPVVQYILNNQDILSPSGIIYILAFYLIFGLLFVIVLPLLLGIIGSTGTLIVLGLAFTTTTTYMALLSSEFHWFEQGSFGIQVLFFCAIFLIGWIIYILINRKALYVIIAIFFLANSAVQLVQGDRAGNTLDINDNKLVGLVGSNIPLSTPNIYLLVYDAYVINDTMLEYGIDNSAQESFLEESGFKLYPHTYSIASDTVSSMSRVLNASTELYGNPRRGVSGDGTVQNLLKSYGYDTYGIFYSGNSFYGIGSSYDYSFPESSGPDSKAKRSEHRLLTKAILMGEFRFDVQFDSPSRAQFLQYKSGIVGTPPQKPRFIYSHSSRPDHSQNSGACLPNETELFRERLIEANAEMKQDVETITKEDPDAIIIVAGDHGPYLTKNCTGTGEQYDISEISRLDIQDRFGTFLAVKWPTEDFSKYDDITVLQDLFPAVFAYLFQDETLLEAKVTPITLDEGVISGVTVDNGIIRGGKNDGDPLFINQR